MHRLGVFALLKVGALVHGEGKLASFRESSRMRKEVKVACCLFGMKLQDVKLQGQLTRLDDGHAIGGRDWQLLCCPCMGKEIMAGHVHGK